LPETIRLNHPLESVKRVLSVLEAVEFKWTIQQVLDTPEDWLDDILTAKGYGEKYKRIREQEEGE
jgi:hypothetical protein